MTGTLTGVAALTALATLAERAALATAGFDLTALERDLGATARFLARDDFAAGRFFAGLGADFRAGFRAGWRAFARDFPPVFFTGRAALRFAAFVLDFPAALDREPLVFVRATLRLLDLTGTSRGEPLLHNVGR